MEDDRREHAPVGQGDYEGVLRCVSLGGDVSLVIAALRVMCH